MEIWERGTWRLSERGRRWFDILLVAALLLPVLAIIISGSWPLWVFSLLEIVPLFWRRRYPTTVFAAVALLSALQTPFTHTPVWGQAAFPIALYSVARYAGGRLGLVALGVGWVGAAVASWVWISGYHVADFGAYAAYDDQSAEPLNVGAG
ncbi:MAG: hypothetical protein J2O46_00090, partial [Nocardioides sp.]|nr:hypothetical protein [Nocardioides sp.]